MTGGGDGRRCATEQSPLGQRASSRALDSVLTANVDDTCSLSLFTMSLLR